MDEADVVALENLAESPAFLDQARLFADLPTVFSKLEAPPLQDRLRTLRQRLLEREAERHAATRQAIRRGELRGQAFIDLVLAQPEDHREMFVDQVLGVSLMPFGVERLPRELIDYLGCGFWPLVHVTRDAPLGPKDVFVDLGSGLGKATMLANLLSGARGIGVELQGLLCEEARHRAGDLGLDVSFIHADAREADLSAGNVFFLYLPFIGTVLDAVMARLHDVAMSKPIIVCGLGIDLVRYKWLEPRPDSSFWLTLYDSR